MNQKQLLRPVADAAALAAPLANYNTADAVEFLNTLELTRAAETLAALPLPRAVKMLEAPELHAAASWWPRCRRPAPPPCWADGR
jgi:magnesium transporter